MKNIAFTIFLTTIAIFANAQSGKEIMLRVDDQTNLPDEYQEMKMSQINSKGKKMDRLLNMHVQRENGNRKLLIVFTHPQDIEGSAFLTLENEGREDDNWLYLPILRRSRRISSSDITDKFMGSDFTYEDLKEEDLDHFEYKYLGVEMVNGYDTYKIEAIPSTEAKKKETGYSKRVINVDKETNLIVTILYYNSNMEHVKTFEAGDIRRVQGTDKFRSYTMRMIDIKKDHITELNFSLIRVNNDFSNNLFTKRTLESGT